jgi:hypothetical protein
MSEIARCSCLHRPPPSPTLPRAQDLIICPPNRSKPSETGGAAAIERGGTMSLASGIGGDDWCVLGTWCFLVLALHSVFYNFYITHTHAHAPRTAGANGLPAAPPPPNGGEQSAGEGRAKSEKRTHPGPGRRRPPGAGRHLGQRAYILLEHRARTTKPGWNPPRPRPPPFVRGPGAGAGEPAEIAGRTPHPTHQAVAIIEKRHPRRPPGSGLGKRPRARAPVIADGQQNLVHLFEQKHASVVRHGAWAVVKRRHVINLVTPRR